MTCWNIGIKLLRHLEIAFSSEQLKKLDAASYNYVLKNINLSLSEDFVESSSAADYAKELIKVKDPNENKKIIAKIKNRLLDLKGRIKEISEKEKKEKCG